MKKILAATNLIIVILLMGCSDTSNPQSTLSPPQQSPSSLTVVPTAAPEGAAGVTSVSTLSVTAWRKLRKYCVMPEVPEHIAFQVPPDTSQIGPQIPDDFFLEVVTPDFIGYSHAVNLAVQVWTINSCEDMLRMIDLGVDGTMPDKPLLLASLRSTPSR
tara:strand:+ start:36548 stop:37024 length:477 start_codon:yes stop_codon:yes gene_type:complete